MKKIISIAMAALLAAAIPITAYAASSAPNTLKAKEMLNPSFQVQDTDNVEFQSFGIMTENYSIGYIKDENNDIVIDRENLLVFDELLKHPSEVKKILTDKARANQRATLSADELERQARDIIEKAQPVVETALRSRSQISTFGSISTTPLENFFSGIETELESITQTPLAPNQVDVKRHFQYAYVWDYMPGATLTDTVAMAWNGSLVPLLSETAFLNIEIDTFGEYHYELFQGPDAVSDMPIASGMGKHYDIHGSLNNKGVASHRGIYATYTVVTVNKSENPTLHATGRYFHKTLGATASITVGITGAGVPSIGLSLGVTSRYQQSPSTSIAFHLRDQ